MVIISLTMQSAIYGQNATIQHTKGPNGGWIGDLILDKADRIFAGVYTKFGPNYRGIYLSQDKGNTWQKFETHIKDWNVYTLFKASNGDLWAGTYYDGALFCSTDEGRTWVNKRVGYTGASCWAMAETQTGALIAGDVTGSSGIFISSNQGDNWQSVFPGVKPFCFLKSKNNTLYCGAANGLYKSTDEGITWSQTPLFSGRECASLLEDYKGNLYVGTGYWDNGEGLFQSIDSGRTWRFIGFNQERVLSLIADKNDTIYVGTGNSGVYSTGDMGINWERITPAWYRYEAFRLKLNSAGDLFIGSDRYGIFRKNKWENNLEQIGLPIAETRRTKIINDSLIICATESGLQCHNLRSGKWNTFLREDIFEVEFTRSKTIFAISSKNGIFKSTNFGASWDTIPFFAGNSRTINGFVAINDDSLLVTEHSNAYTSLNGGRTWRELNVTPYATRPAVAYSGQYIYLQFLENQSLSICKSNDFGLTFTPIFRNSANNFYNLLFATNGGILFFSKTELPHTTFRSTNNGVFWDTVYTGPTLSIYAKDDGTVLLGADSLSCSFNYGRSYQKFAFEGIQGNFIIDIRELKNGNYLLGTDSYGLYKVEILTDINEDSAKVNCFTLSQNYPNPFNPSTSIRYQIPNAGNVKLVVYDVLGKEVATLVNKEQNPGTYTVIFDGSKLASGVYIYKLTAGNYTATKKLNLLK